MKEHIGVMGVWLGAVPADGVIQANKQAQIFNSYCK